jgi:hypothetical protein
MILCLSAGAAADHPVKLIENRPLSFYPVPDKKGLTLSADNSIMAN